MKQLIFIAICTILISACDKEEGLNEKDLSIRPEVPGNDSLDLNYDQIIDFVISYREVATYDEPSSGGSIIGSVSPLNQNQLLYSNSSGYLFLGINSIIKKDSNSNSDWNGFDADLIRIDRDYQNWDRTWTVIPEEQLFYNFLAYKIKTDDSEWIGWICLAFDNETGQIIITDMDISNNDELSIQIKTTN